MRNLKTNKLIIILLVLSILLPIYPCDIVIAVEEIREEEIVTGEVSTPEPISKELKEDTEQVLFPLETQQPKEIEYIDENNYAEERLINEDIGSELITVPELTQKPIMIVDYENAPRNQVHNQIQSNTTTSSALTGKELYNIGILESNEYNNNVSGNLTVNQTSGNVNYSYNLASIPGKNGTIMSLDIEYNSSQSQFGTIGADITDARDYYLDPYMCYEDSDCNIGVGWEFSMTKRSYYSRYYKLRNGEIVDYYYNQGYNYYSISNGVITYIDGTTEKINDDGYIEYSEDKYGNRITYTYEDGEDNRGDTIRLKSITDSLNRSITISYYSNYIDITKPDNSVIRLYIGNVSAEHIGAIRGFDTTLTAKVISRIYNVTDNQPIASFTYEPIEFRQHVGPAGPGIQGDDYGVFMKLNQADMVHDGVRNLEYTIISDKTSDPPYIQSQDTRNWYLCVDKTYSGVSTVPQATYSYQFDEAYKPNLTVTELTANNCVTQTCIDNTNYTYTQKIYERKGNNDILKWNTEIYYAYYDKSKRPTKTIEKIYNENGNYITYQTNYTYDTRGNLLTSSEKVDDNVHIEHSYSYYTKTKYYALKEHTVKKGTDVFTKTVYEVNSLGDVISEKVYDENDNLQRNTGYTYSNNNLTGKIIYNGATTSILQRENYSYTGAYITRVYTTNASNSVIADISYTYDNNTGRVILITDVNCAESVQYDSLGRITRETHSDGKYKSISYSYIDTVICVRNENNYLSEYWYNNQGKLRLVSEQTAYEDAYPLQTLTYDTVGNPIAVKDALNNTTNITYDAFGRQISVKYPGNTATAKAKYYDVFLEGNTKYSVYLTISETGRIACEYYDIYGRLAKTAMVKNYSSFSASSFNNIYQMPANAELVITSRYVYDDLDRVIEQYDGENRPTYYTYDAMGNVINMKQGDPGENDPQIEISYEYNSAGNLVKTTQGTHITRCEYDYAGRLTKMTDPMGYTETYTYDTAGNVKTAKDKNSMVTTNTYNNRGLLSRTSKGSEYIEYTYDGAGNVLTSKDKNGTISYTYNKDGTLASKTYPDGKTITYSLYNGNKALTSMTDYLGNTTTYTYNARGAVTAIGEKYSGTNTTKTTSYTYYTDGSLQKVTYPLGSYMTSVYTYDYAGRVSNLTNKLTSSSTYSTHEYTYDNSGNVTQKIDTISGTSKTTSYIYDSVNRLIKETIGSSWNRYYYDQYNNITSEIGWGDVHYTYNANNQLTKVVDEWARDDTTEGWAVMADWTTNYIYDNNGDLLLSFKTANNGYDGRTRTYSYDRWGRLTDFSDDLGETASYSYYSDGLRASKTIGSNTTKYYYDGSNVINETLNGSSYATNVVGADGYVSRKQNSTVGYLFKNAHGDVLAAYSSTTNKLADYTYNAWGELRSETETSSFTNNPLRYNGEYYDAESGMTYLRARYYDSSLRRFITEDPIKDGLNWYTYAGNNPVMFVDPSGLELQIQDYVDWYMEQLDILSDDTLEIDEYGYVTISSYVDEPNASTSLVRRIIQDSQLCILTTDFENILPYSTKYFKEDEHRNLYGKSGGIVTINPNHFAANKVNLENGENVLSPEYISVAHELIHILRAMGGNHKNYKVWHNGAWIKAEELDTTGLNYTYEGTTYDAGNWVTTENAIRDLFELPRRRSYN